MDYSMVIKEEVIPSAPVRDRDLTGWRLSVHPSKQEQNRIRIEQAFLRKYIQCPIRAKFEAITYEKALYNCSFADVGYDTCINNLVKILSSDESFKFIGSEFHPTTYYEILKGGFETPTALSDPNYSKFWQFRVELMAAYLITLINISNGFLEDLSADLTEQTAEVKQTLADNYRDFFTSTKNFMFMISRKESDDYSLKFKERYGSRALLEAIVSSFEEDYEEEEEEEEEMDSDEEHLW